MMDRKPPGTDDFEMFEPFATPVLAFIFTAAQSARALIWPNRSGRRPAISRLFVAEGFDGMQPGRFLSRPNPEYHADGDRKDHGERDAGDGD